MDANFTARSIAQITNEELLQAFVKMRKYLNGSQTGRYLQSIWHAAAVKKEAQTDLPDLKTFSG